MSTIPRKMFSFIRSRPIEVAALLLLSVSFILAIRDHSATSAYGNLLAICCLISGFLGPKISLKLTLPEIHREMRKAGIPRYQKVRRIVNFICLGLLGLFLYSFFSGF
jgi:hypothetical protein